MNETLTFVKDNLHLQGQIISKSFGTSRSTLELLQGYILEVQGHCVTVLLSVCLLLCCLLKFILNHLCLTVFSFQ